VDVIPDAAAPPSAGPAPSARVPLPTRRWWHGLARVPAVRWAAAATALFAAGGVAHLSGGPVALSWTLFLACLVTGGWRPAFEGLAALRERRLDVDLLMVVAAVGAAAIGQLLDAGLLIVIFATSGALEAVAARRTEESVRSLLDLAPPRAARVDDDGGTTVVDATDLVPGDVVLVRPGERLTADGTVVDGTGDVDQSTITGEPLPVAVAPGHEVFAGTVNGLGALHVRVDRPAGEFAVARIVALVEQAAETPARTQRLVERIEQRYSVTVVVATLAVFGVPLLLGGALDDALVRAMTFMIVASPCAVVLATMPPLLAAIATAGRHGVLLKSAAVAETLGTVTTVAFDKTGTLTHGRPRVVELWVADPGDDRDELLACAAAAERGSEHPLARAVLDAADGLVVPPAEDFRALPGRGVRALVGGQDVTVGSAGDAFPAERARLEAAGHTVIAVAVDGAPAGLLAVADPVREEATDTVARLERLLGRGPVLLTGDAEAPARRLAATVGVREVHAGLLPADKVDLVTERQDRGERVVVVGDGINDAPALAAADVGVAMGGVGADLALDTADAVVLRDEIGTVPTTLALCRRARRVVLANLVLAGVMIVALVTWDLVGTLPLPLGVAGHEGSTVLVGLNGLRLLGARAWRRARVDAAHDARRPFQVGSNR
jgi:cation-transporting P-type ATPase J